MKTSWQSNSKLSILISLLDNGYSVKKIIQLNSNYSKNLGEELINIVTERSTACLIADLYSRLCESHRNELLINDSDVSNLENEWALMWWAPVLKALESNDKSKSAYTYEYILPRIIKIYPDELKLCKKLSRSPASLIACAKITRSLGFSSSYITDLFNQGFLEISIVNENDQMRLDSLALICDNPKTTEAISTIEFKLIKKFLTYNCDISSPSYRQTMLASMKKLFFRFKESWLSSYKSLYKMKLQKKSIEYSSFEESFKKLNSSYNQFINWLYKFLFNSLHLDSTFAKRNQNLSILTLLDEVIGKNLSVEDNLNNNERLIELYNYKNHIDKRRLISLIECLWDTYIVNKNLTLELLYKIDNEIYEKNEFSSADYLKTALNLLSSRKPVDSMTSVYLVMLLRNKANINDLIDSNSFVDDEYSSKNNLNLKIYLIKAIVNEFEKHCQVAKQNLLLACLEKPIYGPLAAVHSLIVNSMDKISDSKNDKEILELKDIISHLIELCFDVSQVTSQIVNSTSPEGIFPSELVQVIEKETFFF